MRNIPRNARALRLGLAACLLSIAAGAMAYDHSGAEELQLNHQYVYEGYGDNMTRWYYYFTPEMDGTLTSTGNGQLSHFEDDTYDDKDALDDVTNGFADDGQKTSSLPVTAGVTYYLRYYGSMSSTTTFICELIPGDQKPELTALEPAEGETLDITYMGIITMRFNLPVTMGEATLSAGGASEPVNVNYANGYYSVSVKDAVYGWLSDGTAHGGDAVTLTIRDVCLESDPTNVYGDDGTLALTWVCPDMPASVVEESWPETFYSYWEEGDPDGIVTLTFSSDLLSMEDGQTAKATVGYGMREGEDAEYYTETLDTEKVTVEGNVLKVDFTGVSRTRAEMLPGASTEYTEVLVTINYVLDAGGQYCWTDVQGGIASYQRNIDYVDLDGGTTGGETTPTDSVEVSGGGDSKANGYTMYTRGANNSLWAIGLSPGGRYMTGWLGSGVGSALLDTETDTYYIVEGSSEYCAVSDDGMMVGYGVGFAYNPITGESLPGGEDMIGKGISTDGTIVVGVSGSSAAYWKDGQVRMLPQPTEEELGFEFQQTVALDVSDDGSVICGYVTDWYLGMGGLMWYLVDGEYVLDPICAGYHEGGDGNNPYYQDAPTAMSHNGKYVAFTLSENDGSWTGGTVHVARYNVETGEVEVGNVGSDISSTRIANDGTMLVHTGDLDSQMRRAMIWEPGQSAPAYMSELYPDIAEFALYDEDDWNYGTCISSDGRYICGQAWHYIEGEGEDYARRISWLFDREAYGNDTGIHDAGALLKTDADCEPEFYSLDGMRLDAPRKGLNIVKTGGKARKVMVR